MGVVFPTVSATPKTPHGGLRPGPAYKYKLAPGPPAYNHKLFPGALFILLSHPLPPQTRNPSMVMSQQFVNPSFSNAGFSTTCDLADCICLKNRQVPAAGCRQLVTWPCLDLCCFTLFHFRATTASRNLFLGLACFFLLEESQHLENDCFGGFVFYLSALRLFASCFNCRSTFVF